LNPNREEYEGERATRGVQVISIMERTDDRSGRRVRAIRVYTLCQESRYLIVRNVPALGCIDELVKLFALYGPIEEYRLMDEEDCEEFTDVYWIKFAHISNARFAKRKLDEYQFLGNLLQVSYAPNHETLADTHNKLEERRRTVLNRLKCKPPPR
jgi:RNA recognition motif-containing protein